MGHDGVDHGGDGGPGSPDKPVLVFVASRRQTRLTALDLISLCARADNPRRFVRMPEEEAQAASESVRYEALISARYCPNDNAENYG